MRIAAWLVAAGLLVLGSVRQWGIRSSFDEQRQRRRAARAANEEARAKQCEDDEDCWAQPSLAQATGAIVAESPARPKMPV